MQTKKERNQKINCLLSTSKRVFKVKRKDTIMAKLKHLANHFICTFVHLYKRRTSACKGRKFNVFFQKHIMIDEKKTLKI